MQKYQSEDQLVQMIKTIAMGYEGKTDAKLSQWNEQNFIPNYCKEVKERATRGFSLCLQFGGLHFATLEIQKDFRGFKEKQ